ncbi:MAG: choloylglycine hydrolase family protein, partial [Desulfobacterales bacterium]|nr:choloylglycine hydrolase family protein [Desulfobacterales bacterium]
MNFIKRALTSYLLLALVIPVVLYETASACTSLALVADDGAVVYGRTMEWGAFDLNSRVAIVPRGHEFQGHTPDGKPGHRWKARYGVVGLDALEKDYMLTDGMNEKGLVMGFLYLPGFAKLQPYDPAQANISMSSMELVNYVLTQFATVDEVRKGLKKIRVVPVPEPAFGGDPGPMHYTVIEKSGKAIVVQYLKGKLKIFDNPLRVATNSPPFDWHMTNLRNYVNLSAVAWPAKKIEGMDFAPIGAGSGFLGLPGDYTPPSRFVRAVAYTQTARKTPDGDETVYEVFRIMDNFNLPLGSAEGSDSDTKLLEGMRSSTCWTIAADTRNLKLYYHTQHNRKVRMVDLKRIDFSPNKEGLRRFPLD